MSGPRTNAAVAEAREVLAMDEIDSAISWLSEPSDPGTVATAQAHATLAVAYALTGILRLIEAEPGETDG